jgi:hypothetical protein
MRLKRFFIETVEVGGGGHFPIRRRLLLVAPVPCVATLRGGFRGEPSL